MYRKGVVTPIATLLVCTLFLASCVAYPSHRQAGYGPPPYAPANGYRYTYYDHDLVFDRNLGVYVVVGMPHYYFYHDRYYRYGGGTWYNSSHLDSGWQRTETRHLPPGLAKKYGHDYDDDDHGHDHGHHWHDG